MEMKLNDRPNKLWTVHINNKLMNMYTRREEARARKAELQSTTDDKVTLGYIPVNYGFWTTDSHS